MVRGELVGLAGRLDGPALGQSFGALLDCLVDWFVGFLVWVRCLVNWSIGYWIQSLVVWCDSGSYRLSAILWSVGRLVGQSVVGLILIGCSVVGQSVVWAVVVSVSESFRWFVVGMIGLLVVNKFCV